MAELKSEANGDLDIPNDVLFVGMGSSPLCYYRAMLPAMALGCDWVGLNGEPPNLHWATGLVKDENGEPQSAMPDLLSYKVVVLQQPSGKGWLQAIDAMRAEGVKVVYEIDDYVHGIKFMEDHDFQAHFDNSYLAKAEAAMKRCDALIASTEWIRGNYSHFNKQAYLCRNGIDLRRYSLTKPDRTTVNVGWAGGTGHTKTIIPWLQQVAGIMRIKPEVCFVSIGQMYAAGFAQHFGEERAIVVPFAAIEQYPAAMTMFDIALAPGGHGGWWRGKSDLRWLEAGALGIPIIANPRIYPDIEDGVTGFYARSPEEVTEKLWLLLNEPDLRTEVGANAQRLISEERSMAAMSKQWADVFNEVIAA